MANQLGRIRSRDHQCGEQGLQVRGWRPGEEHDRKADESNNDSHDQDHEHGAVFNVVSGLERVVPVIKEF